MFDFSGIIYDVIVEPPSVGQTLDERGNAKPVAFLAYRFVSADIFARAGGVPQEFLQRFLIVLHI